MKRTLIIIGAVVSFVATIAAQEVASLKLENLESFNGASYKLSQVDGREILQSLPKVGKADRGAFLKGVEFSEGTIEVRLRGASQPASSFLGVVFRGRDGKDYEAVYFRPFNFGHRDKAKRAHAVQYMCHPKWPWRKLRQTKPEQFENPASPEPDGDDWFEAKIEVADGRVKVYLNDSKSPCLDVESLGDSKKGKVGLWFNGIASFSDLKITPRN